MSILIKGMEMPKNCYECPMESANWCNILEKRAESIDRHQDCPLIEIPPHGRLIDADELLKRKGDAYDSRGHLLYAVGTGSIVTAPTIIEAEE